MLRFLGTPARGTAVREVLRAALFLGPAFFLTLLLEKSYIVQSDEGYTLNAAWQLWNGMKLYDDFRHFVGPGSAYSVYLLWSVLGRPSYLAARLLSLALSFSATTALYVILRKAGVRGLNLALSVAAWIYASAMYALLNHNPFSSFAAIWFLLACLRVAWKEDDGGAGSTTADHVLVGFAAGMVFVFHQTKGLALAFAAVALTVFAGAGKQRRRPLLALGGGFIAVVAPLFVVWRPAVLVREWFVVPITGNYLRHTSASYAIVIVSVAVTCGMGLVALRSRDRTLRTLAVVQAALLASMSHNMESGHLAVNSFPFILFVSIALRGRFERSGGKSRISSELAMASVVALWGAMIVTNPGLASTSTLYVDILGRGSRTLSSSPRVAAAHAIYAGPFLPGFYYQLGKPNPFFVSETVVCNGPCQERLVAQLAEVKPEIAIFDYGMVRPWGYNENGPVDTYLRARYVLCPGDQGGYVVRAIDATWCP